jgi:anti-sigma regulatory factor (Ser/Thr protein kinase)
VGDVITGQRLLGTPLPAALTVAAEPDVAEARRLAVAAARAQCFGSPHEGRVAIVATEMATNLVKYAYSGRILVRLVVCDTLPGVELVAIDEGPGMHDAPDRVADGYSTGGTLGGGLGAIARLSDLFDLYSVPARGTVLMARLWAGSPAAPADRCFLVGAVAEAIPGEAVSGDSWAVEQRGDRIVALVADGLGHGVLAAEASVAAVEVFRRRHRDAPEAILAAIHTALSSTRGAAVAVAEIDGKAGRIRYCGVGNIMARLLIGGGQRQLMSHYGIAGHQTPRIQPVEAAWDEGALLVMHSDGLSTRWDFAAYPGLDGHHPALAAAIVLRDGGRRNDDATVLAIRGAVPGDRDAGAEVS